MEKEYVALIDIIPKDIDVDFDALVDKLKKVLPKTCVITTHEVLPVAFGLNKARVQVRYPAEWGGTDKIEELFGQVEGLQGIEGIAFSKS